MEIVLSVLVSILSIALIAVVLLQDGKDQGLGALAGNADSCCGALFDSRCVFCLRI